MSEEISTVAMKWQEDLALRGYERRIKNRRDFSRLTRLSRTWKIILKSTKFEPGASVFEFGCGGGNQLVPLALRGYRCCGIDCSEKVLVRCKEFISDAERFAGRSLNIQLLCGDFLACSPRDSYDLVFNFGVIEHFINDQEREVAIRKMLSLCKPGGYVVSVVPNGQHPMRERMRKEGLGGYRIPEIDYDCALMSKEMAKADAEQILVIPYNLFGYLMIKPSTYFMRSARKIYHCLWQMAPLSLLPKEFVSKHAHGLIGIAKLA